MLHYHCMLLFRGNNKENIEQGLSSSDENALHFSLWLSKANPQHSLSDTCTVPKQLLHHTFASWCHILYFLHVHTKESLVAVFKQRSSGLGLVLMKTLEAKPEHRTTIGLTLAYSHNVYCCRSSSPRSGIPLCLVRHKRTKDHSCLKALAQLN